MSKKEVCVDDVIVDPGKITMIIYGEKSTAFEIQASIIPSGFMVECLKASLYGLHDRKTGEELCKLVWEILNRRLGATILTGVESGRIKFPPGNPKRVFIKVILKTWVEEKDGKMMWEPGIEVPQKLNEDAFFRSTFIECLEACRTRVLQI